jgi:hypothetical protein
LSRLANSASGESRTTPMSELTLASLLVGMLTLPSLEMARRASRQASHAAAVRANEQPSPGPGGRPADPLTPRGTPA